MENSYHIPVLLEKTVEGLAIRPDGVYVDVTFGGGGHSRAILSKLNEHGKLFAFDQDEDAKQNSIDDPRFELIDANFRYLKKFLRFKGVKQVDGVLGDFGVSSHQFNVAERGFSTRFDAKLDMRMNQQDKLSAYQLVNEYDEANLTRVLREYGEFRIASKIAQAIIAKRNEAPIETTQQLNAIVSTFFSSLKLNKMLAMVYQAIRIEVNQEIDALKEFLMQTADVVKPGGRISLIAYHSLEDRLVKRYIRAGNFEGEAEKDFYGRIHVPFKKVGGLITPGKEELQRNTRSRSAKLRIAERLKDE
jgi:16S rRNA (cytosine1402-N4)-methyltransferase